IPDYPGPAPQVPPRFDVIRGYLHFYGPATPKHVAEFLDAPVKDVQARWPADAVEVSVDGQTRWLLAADSDLLADAGPTGVTRLLGPYDLYLQARARTLLVADETRAKALWPVLGRPGAVLADGEIVGLWRPRTSGRGLRLEITPWETFSSPLRAAITTEAERLAAYRDVRLTEVTFAE
ncbi:MAG: winged helix DNA-binding domain-containing protein, partial [Frankia sp.]|nr:winged helix DNA-binding domain-containing protein [Frankia sp.]